MNNNHKMMSPQPVRKVTQQPQQRQPSSRHSSPSRTPLEEKSVNAAEQQQQQQQPQVVAIATAHAAAEATANPSLVELTALRFDAERRRAVVEQKTKQIQRLETENARLLEQLDHARSLESDRKRASESTLHVEIDTLRRSLRSSQDEATVLGLAKSSLEAKLDTAERRVAALRHLEETNVVLEKEVSLREREVTKLKQELLQSERKAQEAAQASLCNVLQGKIGALETMVAEREAQIGELRSNCAQLESTLTDTRHSHSMNMERCESLEKLTAELRVALTALKTDLAASERLVDAQHEDFNRHFHMLAASKEQLEQRVSLMEELNGELRAEMRDCNRRSQDREFVISELHNELSVTRHELAAARHQAECAAEDEKAAVARMRKMQHAGADREAQIAKQQLLEQNTRGELEALRQETAAARADSTRLRQELHEAARRADLLSHQAAQRDGADERSRQLERQLQRTLEENDSLREAVATARRREVDVESALAKHREGLALIDRLQRDIEDRDAQCSALRREKELAAAELDALRHDLVRARATTSSYVVPQTSPSRRPLPAAAAAASESATALAFGRHATAPRAQSPPQNGRLVQSQAEYMDQKLVAAAGASASSLFQLGSAVVERRTTSPTLTQRRNLAAAAAERAAILRPNITVFSPDRPAQTSMRRGPRQM